jgi:cell division protein FtsB
MKLIRMKRLYIVLLILLHACYSNANNENLKAVYAKLDKAIACSQIYINKREARINLLKQKLKTSNDWKTRYSINFKLYEEYRSYKNDSAIAALRSCVIIAHKQKKLSQESECYALIARQMSKTGYYTESLDILKQINKKSLDHEGRNAYFAAMNNVYGELASYTNDNGLGQKYYKIADAYRDSIYKFFSPDDEEYIEKKIDDLLSKKATYKALNLVNEWLAKTSEGSRTYAIAAFYKQLIISKGGKGGDRRYWLAVSALCDVQNAVMDQASLWTLAQLLSNEGETNRSYNYISFSWRAAHIFGTRIRSWQISPILTSIDRNVQIQTHKSNVRLRFLAASVSLLALLFVILLFYLYRQRSVIAAARNALKKSNSQLEQVNSKLSITNNALQDSNIKLHESNRLKEEYIGQFIGICSLNIDKMDMMRRSVMKMLREKNYDSLMQMIKSSKDKDNETAEFLTNFDAVFLYLFPNFISDFNNLLIDEEQIAPSSRHRLNTPLRIYALMRLGIDNSRKMAEFLHLSLNTVYNYRARMRNAAKGDRDDFEKKVMDLGTIKDI